MDPAAWFQIPDEIAYVSCYTNTLKKGKIPSFLSAAISN